MSKENYFNLIKKSNSQLPRDVLGDREIQTIKSLSSIVGFQFPPNGSSKLIDLGCGDKHLQASVEENGLSYFGLDIDTIDFEKEPLPFEDNSIRLAVSLAVLEHIQDPSFFISEIHRVLEPGGLIYLSTPNFQIDYKNFYNDPTHVRPYTPESIEMILKIHGFKEPNTFPGLRCKPRWFYEGKYRFLKGYYLFPFRGDNYYVPKFLRGKSKSIFALALK